MMEVQHNCDQNITLLNTGQRQTFNNIVESIGLNLATAHNDPARTGKTFLYTTLCHHFGTKCKIVFYVAS